MIIIANMIEGLVYARHCAKSFAWLVLLNPHSHPRKEQFYSHITNEEAEGGEAR